MSEFERLLPVAIRVGTAVISFLLLSIVIAFIQAKLVRVLKAIRRVSSQSARRSIQGAADTWQRFASYWATRQRDFSHPTLIELSRLRRATDGLSKSELALLTKKLDSLNGRLHALAAATDPKAAPSGEIPIRSDATSWFVFATALLALLGMSAANFWLLRLFFQEQTDEALSFFGIGQRLTGADMLAFLFPLVEFASGVILHVLQIKPGERISAARRFMGTVVPWTILPSLAIVELVAYAMLSDNFRLHERFGLTEEHPFYIVVRYFMAPFGVALTLGIAGLGYYVIDVWQVARGPRILSRIHRRSIQASDAVSHLKSQAAGFAAAVQSHIDDADKLLERKLTTIKGGATGAISLGERVSSYAEALLTPAAEAPRLPGALGQLGLFFVLGLAWVLMLWLNSRQYALVARPLDLASAEYAIGYALAGLVTGLGYALGQADYRRRDSQQALLEGHTLPLWILYPTSAAAVGLSMALSVVYSTVSTSALVNSLHGMVIPLGLLFVSLQLPVVLQALVMVGLFWLSVVGVALHLFAAALAFSVEIAAAVIIFGARILAVPGAVLMKRRIA